MIVRELVAKFKWNIDRSGFRSFSKDIDTTKRKAKNLGRDINKIGDNFLNVAKKLTIGLTAPITLLNVLAVKHASFFEQMEVAFSTMLGSAELAQQHIEEMTTFAAETPFTIEGVFTSSKQLLAMGIESEKIKPTLKALGDVAAGLSVPMGRLAYNYGQVRAATKLTGQELKDFVRAGVPLLDELAKNLGKTAGEIKKMVSAGEISFEMVEAAFISMSSEGGKFSNLMEKQLSTLGGIFSNFKDIVQITLAEFGKMAVVQLKLKEGFKKLTTILFKVMRIIRELAPHQKKMLFGFMALLWIIGPLLFLFGGLIKAVGFMAFGFMMLKTALFGASAASVTFQASMLLIPLLVAAVAAAWLLLIEDLWSWANGVDSWVGKSYKPFKKWKEDMIKDFHDIMSLFTMFVDFVTKKWKQLGTLFTDKFPVQTAFLKNVATVVADKNQIAGNASLNAIGKLAKSYSGSPYSPSGIGKGLISSLQGGVNINVNNKNVIDLSGGDSGTDTIEKAKVAANLINQKFTDNLADQFNKVGKYNQLTE